MQLEKAEELSEEAGKSIDQQTLERDAKENAQNMEEPDTEEEKAEDSSPEANEILSQSQVDNKPLEPHKAHLIKVDDSKTEEQKAIEKADKKLKKSIAKDADTKIVASAEQKKAAVAQKEVAKVEKVAQVKVEALTGQMKVAEEAVDNALALKDKQCFFIETAGKDG